MMKKTHMLMGVAATIPFINWSNALIVPFSVLGSIAADWDYMIGIKHRTITHSLLALIVSSISLFIFDWKLSLLWGLNYTTHLILDSFTKTGVPLFYPFSKRYFGFKLFKTRSAEDMFIAMLLLSLIISFI